MPFYEYQCKNCGHELEAMQKVSDAPLKKCPDCGKSQLKRLMSAPVFRLKGGGWYETDFKNKDAQRNLADRPEDTPKDSKEAEPKPTDEKGKDSKDAKTETKASDATSVKESTGGKDTAADRSAQKQSGRGGGNAPPGKGSSKGSRSKKKSLKVKRRR
ncbi:MAG TPA: zinc ribbon domain-containing protein [Steroidobacteraceae bacterium]|jgi:putative FmdB family regulatory protein|nr:zinc ribbon domain-containing protein [Steroidobacteraceae bacterium]